MNRPSESRDAYGEIVTLEQASKRCNLCMNTVREKANECGASLKIGRAYRIRMDKLLEYLYTFQA